MPIFNGRRTLNEDVENKLSCCTKCRIWKPWIEFTIYSEEQRKKKGLRRHTASWCLACYQDRHLDYIKKKRVACGLPAECEKRENLELGIAKCNRCGQQKNLSDFPPSGFRSKVVTHSICRECQRLWKSARKDKSRVQLAASRRRRRENPPERAKQMYVDIRGRCRLKKIPFDIPLEWFQKKIAFGKCEKTGIEFDFKISEEPGVTGSRKPFAPSVDKIDPLGGYLEENVQMVCLMYNMCKSTWTEADVLRMARALVLASKDKLF